MFLCVLLLLGVYPLVSGGHGHHQHQNGVSNATNCPSWKEWTNRTCWWPNQSFNSLPGECTTISLPDTYPDFFKKFIENRAKEQYDMIQEEFNRRGKPTPCGRCSIGFKCRVRNSTDPTADNEATGASESQQQSKRQRREFHHHHHQHNRQATCPPKEFQPVPTSAEECNDSAPCVVTKVNGGCPPPLFLDQNRIMEQQLNDDDYQTTKQPPLEKNRRNVRETAPGNLFVSQEEHLDEHANAIVSPDGGKRKKEKVLRERRSASDEHAEHHHHHHHHHQPHQQQHLLHPGRAMNHPLFHRFATPFELLHGVNCVSNDGSCVCCCGPYVPNVETMKCEDVRRILLNIQNNH